MPAAGTDGLVGSFAAPAKDRPLLVSAPFKHPQSPHKGSAHPNMHHTPSLHDAEASQSPQKESGCYSWERDGRMDL